jgi:beta-galactosidase/beta-glucuronidase
MRRLFLALYLLTGPALISHAQLPAATQGPARTDLSGNWAFRFDPKAEGEAAKWFSTDDRGTWQKARVPGSFNVEFARDAGDTYRFYQGKAWYKTRFRGLDGLRKDVFLHFSGTVLRQKVWLNGTYIGASNLPWLDVSYDITKLIHRGSDNLLVVEVDNSVLPNAIPDTKWRGWWDDGGLIWHVYLEERPRARSEAFVTTTLQSDSEWLLGVHARVHEDTPTKASVKVALSTLGGQTIWRERRDVPPSADDVPIEINTVPRGIQAWSPEHPVLYRLTLQTTAQGQPTDVISFRIGFRQIAVRDTRILLNGRPITLRGINRHEFAPGVGQSVPAAQNRKDLENIKALGANFVRLAHYSQSQDVYNDCDELGLLVWTEIPAWQTSAATLASPEVWNDYAAPQLKAMIEQHRNHPGVIIWSVANEIPSDKPEAASYVAKAIAYVHSLDPTRLATFASDKRERDISMAPVDIIAVNEYYGWYYGKLDDVGPMLDKMHARYPDKPVLVSEFGSEAVEHWSRETAKSGSKDYSYDYQVKLLSAHLAQIYAPMRIDYVAGGVIWVYSDFPDPHRINGDHPDIARYRNSKGLVTVDRVPKPAFATVQQFFRTLMCEQQTGKGGQ